ncbi:hypothetical protein SARC_04301 [Sphaeroforma arctica JP610]|uniref:Autophagy-related protein 2 n=1 Tax=Sphaeroforma arctica JP610 TaxID=667725 RepID=A0A0L0G304_9EUKA|nr:hypothetical protein SARC_04301 [Sphaeroforma arctica JP610]KNC83460.1 hypothetical protein SARC_04301 [Sphaeroforma arctica JP610]|eukprot:XP_014157362.1 hypothetical protein SARC_04301 [Sphaeroforma arctica JP610]
MHAGAAPQPLPFTHRVVLADVRVSLELREGFAFAQNSSATPTHTLTPTQIHTPAYSSTPAQSQQQRNLVQHTDTHTNTSKSPSLASPPVSTKAPSEGGRVTRSEGTDDKDTKRRTRVSSPTHGHTHRAIHIQSPDVDISRPAEGVARETVAREKLSDEKARSKSSPAASPAPVPRTSTTSKRTSTYLDSGSHEGISSTGTNLENDAYSGIGEEDRPPVYGNSEPITFSAVPVPSPASYESITSADVLGYERAELVSETRRNNNNMVVVKTFNGALDLRIYTPDCPKTFRLVVSSDIEIFDRVATSRWNKVMYYWQREAKPRPDVFEDIADETTNAHQPSGVTDGFLEGYNSLTREVNRAVTTIVMVPIQEYKRVGTHGAIKSVIRAVPVAVLRPLIGASDAASKAIQGVRSAVDTQRRDDRADKYKRP